MPTLKDELGALFLERAATIRDETRAKADRKISDLLVEKGEYHHVDVNGKSFAFRPVGGPPFWAAVPIPDGAQAHNAGGGH